jgi:signal transduction histidine kinase
MTGIPGSNMIGKGDYAYTIPFFGEALPQLMDLVFQDDIGLSSRYHNIFREGDTINAEVYCNALYNNMGAWLLAKVSPLRDNSGNIIGAIESLRDITESKKVQQELINAKQQADESNKLKTEFLNNISHEIRTPFNGILGFLSILEDNNLTVSERNEYTGIVNKSAFRLMNTINDIVETSQIQAGQIKLSVVKTNIRKLTSQLYNKFKSDAEGAGLKLYLNNDLPVNIEYINTDNAKLNSILTILIGNAVKFTKTGSIEFGIKLGSSLPAGKSPLEIVGAANINYRDYAYNFTTLEFSIKDTGIGIPKNKQATIFERFIQADGSNTRPFEGSGLGLSIAKAYVEMLGGTIWVESQEEKGAEFHFTILNKGKLEEKL